MYFINEQLKCSVKDKLLKQKMLHEYEMIQYDEMCALNHNAFHITNCHQHH